MLPSLLCLIALFSSGLGDDPKDISTSLESHLTAHAHDVTRVVHIGNIAFKDVVMPNAFLGDLSTMKLINRAWFWRKFIWFSVFGDVKLDDMYLTAENFTIGGKPHSGKISIEENYLHFNWEAIDHFKCTIVKERIDWRPLTRFILHEGTASTELYVSDDDTIKLKRQLLSDDFIIQLRNVLLLCLHPKYPFTYGWEETDHFEW